MKTFSAEVGEIVRANARDEEEIASIEERVSEIVQVMSQEWTRLNF